MIEENQIASGDSGFDGRPELRDHIARMMQMCRHYSAMTQRFAEIGDDAGVAYAMRKSFAYQRAAIGTCNDLFAVNEAAKESEGNK